jgi:hypothetical protein
MRSGESDATGHNVKTIQHQMSGMNTVLEEEPQDFESIVKIRLFLATAALWLLWLLVYVILSHWRLI